MTVIGIDRDVDNADWTKRTLDLPVSSVAQLRTWLEARGQTVEDFVKLPAYRHALDSGDYPWLGDLTASKTATRLRDLRRKAGP